MNSSVVAVYLALGLVITFLLSTTSGPEFNRDQRNLMAAVLMIVLVWPFVLFLRIIGELFKMFAPKDEKKTVDLKKPDDKESD